MNHYFLPHPSLYGIVTGPGPQPPARQPPAAPSPYAQLKELDQRLDLAKSDSASVKMRIG